MTHYSIKEHYLEQLKTGDYKNEITRAALGQSMCKEASVVIVWSAIFQRSKWKYSQRAYRYIYLDAGHIAQNLAIVATSLNLGTCQIAALYDDISNSLFDLDGKEESVIYMSTVGRI
ncbi:MAG: SagB/ThcOx family dehydrogenase [Cyanobacteriota bacterium]